MSITITSFAVYFIGRLLTSAGFPIDDTSITHFVSVGLQILGALGIWYGRYRQGDITWYGKKTR